MKRVFLLLMILVLVPQLFALDVIETRNHQKYYGKVVGRKGNGFLLRTREGSVVVIPNSNILSIKQGNNVYDFESGMKYHVETKRPFLPLAVLGAASGYYAVKKFQDYDKHNKEKQEAEKGQGGVTYSGVQPSSDMAKGIVSSLLCVGSFYVALRPMEVKVPLGKIKISAAPNQIQVALHF